MFSVFVEKLGGYFDRRWMLASFFPSLAFWGGNLLFALAVIGLDNAIVLWKSLGVDLQLVVSFIALAWVVFFAVLLSNFDLALIRLFEGYWEARLIAPLAAFKRTRHQTRWRELRAAALQAAKAAQQMEKENPNRDEDSRERIAEQREKEMSLSRERFLFYPSEVSAVMPTRLGNILRASEMYASNRYGMDSVGLWTRLAPLLPKEFGDSVADARTALDLDVNINALAILLGLAWGVYFIYRQWWVWLVFVGLVLLLGWLAYGNALHAARAYGETIKAAFDLYRWNLLDALHLPHPTSTEQEPALWEKVSAFVFRGYPLNMDFVSKPPEPERREVED